jgi:hypothetical protein
MDKKYTCKFCNKKYVNKSNHDKHVILCEFSYKTTREKQNDAEESEDLPSYSDLVKIMHELLKKQNKMEEKIHQLEAIVNKQKKKINIYTWLNEHVTPTAKYSDFIKTFLKFDVSYIELLINETLFKCIETIFKDNLSSKQIPINCFTQKSNIIYVYESDNLGDNESDNNMSKWCEITDKQFNSLLININNNLLKMLPEWKKQNMNTMNHDKLCEIEQKIIRKVMSNELLPSTTGLRMKRILYDALKIDLKLNFEFDFEF